MNKLRQHKILIVDDRADNLLSISAVLKKANFSSDTALSGVDALKLLLQNDYGLIILDVQMPEMNGFELAELIKGNSKTKEIPIIFLSANAHEKEYFTKGYEVGGLDYLSKPVDEQHLVLKVTNFIALHDSKMQLQKALEKEKSLADLKSRFVSDASHQFRTPMSIIKATVGIITMISEDCNPGVKEKVLELKERVDKEIENMVLLMDDLLTFGKSDIGNIKAKFESINLSVLCDELCDEFNNLQSDERKIIFKESGTPRELNIDPNLFSHSLNNLISNAFKYSDEKNPEILLDYNDDRLQIIVQDHGVGIPSEELEYLFTPFFRAHNVQHIKGTGLGLSIAKNYFELNAADLRVESEINKGSKFIITLPFESNKTLEKLLV